METKTKVMLSTVLALVLIIGFGFTVYNHNKESEMEKKLAEEVEQGIIDYENYLNEKGVYYLYEEAVIESQNFLDEMNYSDKAEYEIASYIHDEINFKLSSYFPQFYEYNYTFEYPAKLRAIVEKDYITEENKRDFETTLAKSKKNAAWLDKMSSMTDYELNQLFERSEKKIDIGDTSNEVTEKIGSPNDRTKSTDSSGVLEIWYYNDEIIYIEDGVVYKTVEL